MQGVTDMIEQSTAQTIPPHGGKLVDLQVPAEQAAKWQESSRSLPQIVLNTRQLSDVEMLAIGGFSPLTGFLGRRDYQAVLKDLRLASGVVWPIPITLVVSSPEAKTLEKTSNVLLVDDQKSPVAVLHVTELYGYDKPTEAQAVYRTTEERHPGVAALYQQGEVLVGGNLEVLHLPRHDDFKEYRLPPAEVRRRCQERGWRRVVGFQTRNPVHRAHEYLLRCALEVVDGLLLHPLVGETKSDDLPAAVRMRCYEALLTRYFPKGRVLLAVNPAAMRYAGPREAIFHALVRKNYGCTHFIVGRDHAGVGNYYGPYDAQKIFDQFPPHDLGITPLFFENAFYCARCQTMATTKTCPHPEQDHLSLSGTKVRELLSRGEPLPETFTRPEVAQALGSEFGVRS